LKTQTPLVNAEKVRGYMGYYVQPLISVLQSHTASSSNYVKPILGFVFLTFVAYLYQACFCI